MTPALLALDLDGTLLRDRRGVPPEHRRVVEHFVNAGTTVAIVTGRPLLTARPVWDELGLDSWLVCFNGVWVVDHSGTVHHDASLSGDEAADILTAIGDEAGTVCVYPDADTWIIDRFTAITERWEHSYAVPIHTKADLRATWREPTAKVMVVSDPPAIIALESRLRQQLGSRFHLVISEPDRLEIHAAHATKAWGLSHIAQHLGIAQADVWAVGDGANDVEMLQWAGRGFAMGQASQRVQDHADAILPSVHEDGLCGLLA